jgi:hypothetical protein
MKGSVRKREEKGKECGWRKKEGEEVEGGRKNEEVEKQKRKGY